METSQNAQTLLLQTAEELVQANRLEDAIAFLLRFDEQTKAGIRQDIIMQSGNFNQVHQMFTQGMLDDARYFQMTARTRFALLEVVKSVPRRLALNAKINSLGAYQFDVPDSAQLEKVIGSKDNLMTINWLEKALQFSKTVCRIAFIDEKGRQSYGTGFLDKEGYLFTNNHVLSSVEIAKGARLEFNYEVDAEGTIKPQTVYHLDTSYFITSPPNELDFTRVKVVDDASTPLKQWGHVDFAPDAIPAVGDPVTIIQHPQGGVKKIALRANEVLQVQNQLLRYTTDTEGGSSGSPVFNQNWQVIGIHHAGKVIDIGGQKRDANEGILFRDIFAFIAKSK